MRFSPAILLALFASANAQGFFTTCLQYPNIDLSGSVLETACVDESDTVVYASIDLNGCVSNYFGTLIWARNGDYSASCWDCFLGEYADIESQSLDCTCANGSGGSDYTTLNLNTNLANYNGVLVCNV